MPNCHDDPSVEKAVDVLLEQLKKNPPQKPAMPAGPERSKRIEKVIRRP
jgi:tricorn protease